MMHHLWNVKQLESIATGIYLIFSIIIVSL